MRKHYNTQNLKPFTKDNASYYGSKGGYASGKSKLKGNITKQRLRLGMIEYELAPYLNRVRFYKRDYDFIKARLHDYKITKNRLNKLIDKYNKKYQLYREGTGDI